MDTQGLYDRQNDRKASTFLFGISTLISSTTIYNVQADITEQDLNSLAVFSEYSQLVLNKTKNLRDYCHFNLGDKNIDFNSVYDQGEEYLKEAMSSKTIDEHLAVREKITLCFRDITCCCLPYPGEYVTEADKKFNGEANLLNPRFRILLGDYVYRMFSSKLEQKEILGNIVTASFLLEAIKKYCSLFKSGKGIPEAKSLFQMTQEANFEYGKKAAQKLFNKKIKDIDIKVEDMTLSKLENSHEQVLNESTELLKCYLNSGSKKARKVLEQGIKELALTSKSILKEHLDIFRLYSLKKGETLYKRKMEEVVGSHSQYIFVDDLKKFHCETKLEVNDMLLRMIDLPLGDFSELQDQVINKIGVTVEELFKEYISANDEKASISVGASRLFIKGLDTVAKGVGQAAVGMAVIMTRRRPRTLIGRSIFRRRRN
eukprot:snap_masked-scaffold_102-processed-gene-0.17-mRNA-1 protein AED:0.60 eAED:0.60 QI:0/0/0/0.5/1/1/2/0/429